MLFEAMILGTVATTFLAADRANGMEAQAADKYAKSYEKDREADLLMKNKAQVVDKRLMNVVKKKKAVLDISVPRFVEVYSQIQKIDLQQETSLVAFGSVMDIKSIHNIKYLEKVSKKEFTGNELICGLLFKGFNGMMVEDAKRTLNAANHQLNLAEMRYSQAENMCVIYDGIIEKADQIASLLAKLNVLFLKSINNAQITIKKNGLDIKNYTRHDKEVLMTCVNFASAMADLVNIPVISENGTLVKESEKLLQNGNEFLTRMEKAIQ